MLKPIGEAQWLVTVEGIEGIWEKMSAPKISVEKIKYTDPQKLIVRTHRGAITNEEVTLTKKYDAVTDTALITWIQDRQQGAATLEPFVVTASPVYADVNGTPYDGSSKFQLTGCILLDATYPAMDRESKNLANIEITLYFENITAA